MGPIASIDDFLDMVRRRAGLILLIAFAGCAVSLFVAWSFQHEYRATEIIQVDQPDVSGDLARSSVEGTAARRLQLIEQRLMARDSVLDMIAKFGLFTDRPKLSDTEKVALLRKAVTIETVAGRGGRRDDGSVSIVSVSAQLPSPEQARAVASEYAQRTIALYRENRMARVRATLDFLIAQERTLADDVAALERQIAEYRKANALALPESVEARRGEIAALNQTLLEIGRERIGIERAAAQVDTSRGNATAQRVKARYAEQIATLDAQSKLLLDRKSELEQSIATAPEIERKLAEFDRRLTNLKNQLDDVAARRSEAETSYRLEVARLSEQMRVIEPAVAPEKPVKGSRRKIAILGSGFSIALALLVALLLELRRPVLRSAAHVERELGFPPVVSVPVMKPRRRLWPFPRRENSAV